MTNLQLYTANYVGFTPDLGVPVRTSRGYPRFVRYKIPYVIRELWPDRAIMTLEDPIEFEQLYRRGLNEIGVGPVMGRLEEIAADAGDGRLVLMCFENLAQPGAWCHRTVLGRWLEEQSGVPVQELAPGP